MAKRDEKAFQRKRNDIFKAYVKIRKDKKENPSYSDLDAIGITKATVEYYWKSLLALEKESMEKNPKLYDEGHRLGQRKDRKEEVLEAYVELRRTMRREVTTRDLTQSQTKDLSRDLVQTYWGGIQAISEEARKRYPDAFHDIPLEQIINHKDHKEKIQKWVKGYDRFFITTAVIGCDINEGFYKSILKFCELRKAKA